MEQVPQEVRSYLAAIGRKGGAKSRRRLSSEAARDMVRVREARRLFHLTELMEEYREQCLWFLRPDYVPKTSSEIVKVLDLIERYGDRAGYERAEEIKAWLSPHSRAAY
ncbi:MAG: hypothetical protein FJ225_12450 [Lentisphaerae bacterium]|nr:hypothetical protein [Lentisphaerota bacterium]